jgi:sec-independent protein translocase protein TatB
MLNLDPAKLLIIGVVAIILLGPDKLPQVARQVGGAWRSFNEFRHRMETEVRSSIPDLPSSHDIARLARSPSALLNHLSNMSPDGSAGSTTPGDPAVSETDAPPATPPPVPPTTVHASVTSPEPAIPGDPSLN